MNNYIVLDGKRYKTRFPGWEPITSKPSTIRVTLGGSLDVTYGPSSIQGWDGEILAPVTPDTVDYGDIDDLRTSLAKTQGLSMTDHYGNVYTVHVVGSYRETSSSPMWDAATNEFRVPVRLVRE